MKQDVLNIGSALEADLGSYLPPKLSCHLPATEQWTRNAPFPPLFPSSTFRVPPCGGINYAITWNSSARHRLTTGSFHPLVDSCCCNHTLLLAFLSLLQHTQCRGCNFFASPWVMSPDITAENPRMLRWGAEDHSGLICWCSFFIHMTRLM